MKLNLTLTQRVLLFICISFVGFFMTGVLTAIVLHVFGATSPSMRIVTVLQDILVFILPAVVTALLVTRQPATLLCIDRRPPMAPLVLAIFTLLCSIPAMNYVIWLNANVPLPEGIASTLKSLEANAEGSIELIIGSHDVPNLVVAVLIVGVFAGVSEEIMFRGGFQRLLSTGGVGVHAAIWITAVVFSILHLQFYGFVPRMLLGAFFGYTLVWTRSLWVPVILHALNNSMYVIDHWINYPNESTGMEALGSGSDYAMVIASVVLTAIGLIQIKRCSR